MSKNVQVNFGCLGCAFSIFGIIAVIFILTHISEIWHWMERLFQ